MGNCCEEQDTKNKSKEYIVNKTYRVDPNPIIEILPEGKETSGGYIPEAKKMYKTPMADDL